MEFRQRPQLTRSGISLIEALLTIGIVGAIASWGLTGYAQTRERGIITQATAQLESAIREAQARSIHADRGSAWSLECHGRQVVVTTIDHAATITRALPGDLQCPEGEQVHFTKLTGLPESPAELHVTAHGRPVKVCIVSIAGTITTTTP